MIPSNQNVITPSRSVHAVELDTVALVLLGPELPLLPLPLLCDGDDDDDDDDVAVDAAVLVLGASAVAPAEHFLMRPVSKQAPLWTPHSL